jgi:hypothetical protein
VSSSVLSNFNPVTNEGRQITLLRGNMKQHFGPGYIVQPRSEDDFSLGN